MLENDERKHDDLLYSVKVLLVDTQSFGIKYTIHHDHRLIQYNHFNHVNIICTSNKVLNHLHAPDKLFQNYYS